MKRRWTTLNAVLVLLFLGTASSQNAQEAPPAPEKFEQPRHQTFAASTRAQTTATSAELKISGDVSTQLTLTAADLKKMPRKTLSVMNPHEKKTETYEGVPLQEILHRAGVPQGEQVRGVVMASYVVVEAEDGYRVVFSLAELEPGIGDAEVIVADAMDGAPLGAKQGPFKLVAPHDKRPARWVRMLKSLTVVRAS